MSKPSDESGEMPVTRNDCWGRYSVLRALFIAMIVVMLVAVGLAGKAALNDSTREANQVNIKEDVTEIKADIKTLIKTVAGYETRMREGD